VKGCRLDCEGAGWTLHQLRHWLLTHGAESGTSTNKSGRSGKTTAWRDLKVEPAEQAGLRHGGGWPVD
jgi:hypothetical protein